MLQPSFIGRDGAKRVVEAVAIVALTEIIKLGLELLKERLTRRERGGDEACERSDGSGGA